MRCIKNLVASMGKYPGPDGNEKTRWVRLGKLFERPDGSQCIKLDSLPIGEEWKGWINLYDPDDSYNKDTQGEPHHASVAEHALKDDVPF